LALFQVQDFTLFWRIGNRNRA